MVWTNCFFQLLFDIFKVSSIKADQFNLDNDITVVLPSSPSKFEANRSRGSK